MMKINLLNKLKKCTGPCGKIKELLCFGKDKAKSDGLKCRCKECQAQYRVDTREHRREYNKQRRKEKGEILRQKSINYYYNNLDKFQQYRDEHKEEIKEYNDKYRNEHPEEKKRNDKEYRDAHKEESIKYQKQYREEHKIEANEYRKKYNKNRKKEDINYKITGNLRSRMVDAIKNNQKSGSSINDLGCSIDYLKDYFKTMFYLNSDTGEMMSWENYGKWHIDHIVPLSSFDLTDREQFLKACHFTNLQPLWAKDNLQKSDKIS